MFKFIYKRFIEKFGAEQNCGEQTVEINRPFRFEEWDQFLLCSVQNFLSFFKDFWRFHAKILTVIPHFWHSQTNIFATKISSFRIAAKFDCFQILKSKIHLAWLHFHLQKEFIQT